MADTAQELEQLTTYMVKSLVDEPEAVSSVVNELDGVVTIEYSLAAEDIGRVIGRQGRIIKAIRTITRAAGSQSGLSVEVEIDG